MQKPWTKILLVVNVGSLNKKRDLKYYEQIKNEMYKDLPSWYYHVYCFFYNNISAVHPTLLQVDRCYWILYKQELQYYIDGECRNNQQSRRLLSIDFSVCLGFT